MAVWTEISIQVGPTTHQGDAARLWMEANHGDIMPPKNKRGKFVVVLRVDGRFLLDRLAVEYLRDLLGPAFTFRAKPTKSRKHRVMVRRRLANVARFPRPTFQIELSLGDIDAFFDPIGGGDPWTEVGVNQRMQSLGYLYTPFTHPSFPRHAELCWGHYKKVHERAAGGELTNDELVALLRAEADGNLLAARLPRSAQVLAGSTLPAEDAFAAIRFPGGYSTTRSPVNALCAGDHLLNHGNPSNPANRFQFRIGDPRQEIEDVVFEDNDRLGRLPLVARVKKKWADGVWRPVADAKVLFQLIEPGAIPDDSPLAPEPLPTKVMNYTLAGSSWLDESYPTDRNVHVGLSEGEWTAVHRMTKAAHAADPGTAAATAKGWIDAWSQAVAPAVDDQYVAPWYTAGAPNPPLPVDAANVEKLRKKIAHAMGDGGKPNSISVPTLTAPGWGHFKALCRAAEAQAGARDAGITLAGQWLDNWAAAPLIRWADVQGWWGDQGDTPYPALRSKPAWAKERAKERVDFLLQQQAAIQATELDGVGQKKYIDELMASIAQAAPGDPQRHNAPRATWGGHGGAAIDNVFDLPDATAAGFHTRRPTQLTDYGTLALATLPDDRGKNPHAAQCLTNAQGWAGVVFKPSRCGGDRYRLRAYLDADWLETHCSATSAVATRTGTMVVWRNMRMGRYLQLPNPGGAFSAPLQTLLDYGTARPMPAWNPNDTTTREFGLMYLGTTLPTLDVLGAPHPEPQYAAVSPAAASAATEKPMKMRFRPAAMVPDGLSKQLRRAYCELIDDNVGVEQISRQMLRDALEVGKRAWDASGLFPKRIHWPTMIIDDATSPFMLTFRSFSEYNDLLALRRPPPPVRRGSSPSIRVGRPGRDAPPPQETLPEFLYPNLSSADDPEAAMQTMVEAMLEYFAGGGVLPGFTVVQVPRGQTWDMRALSIKTPITSGYGTASRGFYLSHTDGVYRSIFWAYSATANAIHEMGHALGLCHQPPAGADLADAHQPHIQEPFQTPTDDQVVCVMSYSGCYGDYCGKCLLSLRGWAQPQAKNALFV